MKSSFEPKLERKYWRKYFVILTNFEVKMNDDITIKKIPAFFNILKEPLLVKKQTPVSLAIKSIYLCAWSRTMLFTYSKWAWRPHDNATSLSFRYLEVEIQGFHMMYHLPSKGPFKYYVSRGGWVRWGQKMTIFANLQYYLC